MSLRYHRHILLPYDCNRTQIKTKSLGYPPSHTPDITQISIPLSLISGVRGYEYLWYKVWFISGVWEGGYSHPGYHPDIHTLVPRISTLSYPGYHPDLVPQIFIPSYPRYSYPGYHPYIHTLVPQIFIPSYSRYCTPDIHTIVPQIFIPSYHRYSYPRTTDIHTLVPRYSYVRTIDIHTLVPRIFILSSPNPIIRVCW